MLPHTMLRSVYWEGNSVYKKIIWEAEEMTLLFQKSWVPFPESSWLTSSLPTVPGDPMPSSGLHGLQVCTWYTYRHAGKTLIHININIYIY